MPKPIKAWRPPVQGANPKNGGTNPVLAVHLTGWAPVRVSEPMRAPASMIKTATPGNTRILAKRFLAQVMKALELGRALKMSKRGERMTRIMIVR